ncbi:MAG: vitamin K epoxide reductase family protein [Firmicutes bacterium]|nr:vitamin K epoxide reductase family protein [Bacillota bacterium]
MALVGAGLSGYLTATTLAGAAPVCLAGDCATVAASPYARFLGVPTALWGLAAYLAVGGVAAAVAWGRTVPAWLPLLALGLAVFGVIFSLYLLWVQLAVLRAVCSWCAASDALWAILLVLAGIGTLADSSPARDRDKIRS